VPARLDLLGALLFTVGLAATLFGVTLVGSGDEVFGVPIALAIGALLALGVVSLLAAIVHGLRRPDPFLDPRLFATGSSASAALISLLTGYGMATRSWAGPCLWTAFCTAVRRSSGWCSALSPGQWPWARSYRVS